MAGLSEAGITLELMRARGDIFVAANFLGVKPRELNSYIRCSTELQLVATAIGSIKVDPEYIRMSDDQFHAQLMERRAAYKVDAEDVIHDLAMMTFDSAAMADVKLRAAIAMKGTEERKAGDVSQEMVLADLNKLYQESAPRVRQVRAQLIEISYAAPETQVIDL